MDTHAHTMETIPLCDNATNSNSVLDVCMRASVNSFFGAGVMKRCVDTEVCDRVSQCHSYHI
jgi:hypothetical protein